MIKKIKGFTKLNEAILYKKVSNKICAFILIIVMMFSSSSLQAIGMDNGSLNADSTNTVINQDSADQNTETIQVQNQLTDSLQQSENTSLPTDNGGVSDSTSVGTDTIIPLKSTDPQPVVQEADTTVPLLKTAVGNGNILTLNYNETLDEYSVPSLEDFNVEVVYTGSALTTIYTDSAVTTSYTGSAVNVEVEDVAVSNDTVILTLADPVNALDQVVLSYDPDGDATSIRDKSGNEAQGFENQSVINNTGEIPDFIVEKIYKGLDLSPLDDTVAHEFYYAMLRVKNTTVKDLGIMSQNVASVFTQSAIQYNELNDDNKQLVCSFFGISDDFLNYSNEKGENIQQGIEIYLEMKGYGLSDEEIEASIQNNNRDELIQENKQQLQSDNQSKGTLSLMSMAATTTTADEDPFGDIKYREDKELSAPFKHTDEADEQVNLSSGTLEYNVADAVLPGVNGLDLVLQRQYSSEDANYYDVYARLKCNYNFNTYDCKMNVYKKSKTFQKNADGTIGDYISETNDQSIANDYTGSRELKGLYSKEEIQDNGSTYSANLYSKTMNDVTSSMFSDQTSNPTTRNDQLWGLGTGWKFNFSYITSDSFYYNYMKVYLSDGRSFIVSPNWLNNLGYYLYKDVTFATETNTVAGQTSAYTVYYADGKKEYFNSDGRLIAIIDRFGNTISFVYTTVNHRIEMQITDTLGRITKIYNQETSAGYNKVLELPNGKKITYIIESNTSRHIQQSYESYPGEFNEYNLNKVTNQVGEQTTYTYQDIQCGSDFAARYDLSDTKKFMGVDNLSSGKYYPNYYAALSEITYPTGLNVDYEYYERYNAWYDYGCYKDIAVKKRYDKLGSQMKNQKEYSYSYEYLKNGVLQGILYSADGYSNERPESDPFDPFLEMNSYWVKEKDIDRNATSKYAFDRQGYCTQVDSYLGSNLEEATSNEYRIFNHLEHPSKTRITTTKYNTSNSQPITTIACYDYDNKGNDINCWTELAEGNTADNEHKITMTYDPLYNYLTSKTYKRDASTVIVEQNMPSADEKTISQTLTYENNQLKSKSEFTYDTYGNVIHSKVYTALNPDKTIDTNYTYLNGTYLTGIEIQNVKDSDGNNLGSISRSAIYDIYGRIISETDGKSNITTYTYDDIGRIIGIIYPGNISKTYVYDTTQNTTTVTDERDYQTRYQYDQAGNLISIYSLSNGTSDLLKSYQYDNLYRVTREENNLSQNGGAITYSYDYKDQVTEKKALDSSNNTLSQEDYTYYDDKTTKTVAGDVNGSSIITTEYKDKYGRIIKQGRFIGGNEIFNTFAYNYLGEVVGEKSARANNENYTENFTTQYEYNFDGNIKKQYDVLGNFVTNDYDAAGHKIAVTDAKSNTTGGTYKTVYTYDELGRLIKEETPFETGSMAVTKYYYDANGNLTRKQVSNNLPGQTATFTRTDYGYNNRDLLTEVDSYNAGQLANVVNYEYDDAGNMTAMVNGNGTQRTVYEYDRYNHLKTLTDPLGYKENYTYDINGNMTDETDKNGLTTNYTYDGLSRKTGQSVTKDENTKLETKGYTIVGGLKFVQNDNIRTDYTYDELGRVISQSDSNGVVISYTYDADNNLKTSVVKVNGVVQKNIAYVYDKKDRLYQVYDNNTLVATYTYDANGNRSALTYGNGDSVNYAYNLENLVTSLQNKKGTTTLSGYTYSYYQDGNQASKTDNMGRLTNYSYDGLGRLTSEAESGAADAITKSYTFDPAGNRATMSVSGAQTYTVGYNYDLDNRLLAESKNLSNSTEITNYTYDYNGNTIIKNVGTISPGSVSDTPKLSINSPGIEFYTYDGFDRLVSIQSSAGTNSYTYRPDGLRLSKTVNGVTTTHVWEGQDISLELDANGNVTNKYTRGVGLIKSDLNGWYLFNGHGDVVQLAYSSGAISKEYAYDAFGNEKNIDPNDTNPFRYCGEYYDNETGTIYLRARYYDPTTGRFLNEDSNRGKAEDPLSLNLYTYCQNNPIRYVDPSGHSAETAKWSNNQYNYLHNLAAKGNSWAKQQIAQKRYFVDDKGKVYSNSQVWNAKHPHINGKGFYTTGNGPQATFNKSEKALKLVSGEAGVAKITGDYKYGQWGMTGVVAKGDVGIGIDKKGIDVGAYGKVSMAEVNGAVKVPLPFTKHKLLIGGELDLGSIGGGVKANLTTSKPTIRAGLHYGVGADVILGID